MATEDATDLDITTVINTLIPGEKHLPGMRYCEPGTRLDLKLNEDGTPKPGCEPIDRADEAALRHDLAYSRHDDLKNRNKADGTMINELLKIPNPTWRERLERCCVLPIMFVKRVMGSLILAIIDL